MFVKKSNEVLRFYINYRKLNVIIKRNRYFISLINKIFERVQNYKYLIKLNIIIIFNKLRINFISEDYRIFDTFFKIYKYGIFLFGFTNGPVIY